MRIKDHRGFTLIELSIVLVIIGLIIGGVLVGRDLIRNAELRSMHKQAEQFTTAINSFRGKYNCLAGDCPNATDFFGEASGCPALTDDPAVLWNDVQQVATCDGNGDGKIIGSADQLQEYTTVWQQLADAGLIAGTFTGGLLSTGNGFAAGVNVPTVVGTGQFFWITFDGDNATLLIGVPSVGLAPGSVGNVLISEAPLTPAEMRAFDGKFDDGSPATGKIQYPNAVGNPPPHCTDAADETATDSANATAQYLANDPTYKDQGNCGVMYINAW